MDVKGGGTRGSRGNCVTLCMRRKKPFQLESNFPPFLRVSPPAVRDTTLETGSDEELENAFCLLTRILLGRIFRRAFSLEFLELRAGEERV